MIGLEVGERCVWIPAQLLGLADELLNFMANRVARNAVATEETRPDASVNDDIHRAPRSFL